MAKLIKNRALVSDEWSLLKDISALEEIAAFNDQAIIVPLSFWQEHK